MSRNDIRALLIRLRVAFDDADAVTLDMLRSPRDRELGPLLHRQNYHDAKQTVVEELELLTRYFTDPEPAEPTGSAGSPH